MKKEHTKPQDAVRSFLILGDRQRSGLLAVAVGAVAQCHLFNPSQTLVSVQSIPLTRCASNREM
jgi:hypothetical protein